MKITFLLHGNGVCGGIRCVFEISNRLVERGHEVNIVYPAVLPRILPNFSINVLIEQGIRTLGNLRRGIKVYWFPLEAKLIRIFSLSPKFISYFQKYIPDSDLIVATAWETAVALNKMDESKGKKVYFVQHYEVWDMWNDESCWKSYDELDAENISRGAAMCDVVPDKPFIKKMKNLVDSTYKMPFYKIATSSFLKELIEKKFGERVYGQIPVGNNFKIFGIKEFKEKNSKPIKILMPYRGQRWKGDDDGIKALGIVKKRKHSNIKITLYGSAKPSQIPEWATYIERPSDLLLNQLYQEADVFVFPSWVEGWGSPPMEAMACGTACVTTNVGAVLDYAVPEETALVVPPRCPERITDAINRLIGDDDLRNTIARNGFEHIKKFTWDKTVDEIETSFKNILGS